MNLYQKLICILLLMAPCMSTLAQEEVPEEEPIDILLERLDRHQRLQPQEKLYLHLEKEVHDQGEHLWFKIYLVAGALHRPSPISTGAYVELLGPDGSKLLKKYIKVNRGLGYGDIEIGKDLPKGTYRLKAYTQWMKNFDWDYIPETKVDIKQTAAEAAPTGRNCDITFAPEGGTWVAGLTQRLAFKSANGSDISGSISNAEGQELAKFKSTANGIGTTQLEAETGATLLANIDGCDAPVRLPKLMDKGTVMTARKMGQQFIRLDIATNLEEDGSLLYAIIQSRGIVANRLNVQVNGGRARAILPVKDLPAGIVQITLFNEQLSLLSERLVYVDAVNPLEAEATIGASDRDDWQKVDMTLKGESNETVSGHFSVALFSNETPQTSASISPYLNLEAELPQLTNINTFFDEETGLAKAALDEALMTQKWNWITWKSLIMNRLTDTDKSLNTYMNDAYIERQKFKDDEEAIDNLDANARRLDDVVVTAKREEVEENIAVPKIYGKGDGGSLDLDKIQVNNNERLIDMLRGRIAGVYVSGNDRETTINIRGSLTGSGDGLTALAPLILLNNIPSDVGSILDIQARFIKSVEVFKGSQASIFGIKGAGGAIAVYTRNKPAMEPGAVPREEETTEEGEEIPKSYEQPNRYEARPLVDKQGLIYWNPLLVTDDEGKISFDFKKPDDFSGEVYMHIQGIGRNGTPYTLIKKLK